MPGTMTGPACPDCGGEMYDNRATKKNPKQPDFKCKDYKAGCQGVIWPPKTAVVNGNRQQSRTQAQPTTIGDLPGDPAPLTDVDFATLCNRYRECVGYVVKQIVPGLVQADIGCDPASIAAMSATLFIARTKANV
jgi:hypothetical protein